MDHPQVQGAAQVGRTTAQALVGSLTYTYKKIKLFKADY
jgi:hypothetical protein